jgi:hypothetical protein
MATKHKMTVSTQPESRYRRNDTERRAAQVAWLSTQQADLKREAADRRAERAIKSAADATTTPGV